jgi:hypothetical protein
MKLFALLSVLLHNAILLCSLEISRRYVLRNGGATLATGIVLLPTSASHAARGAAELDFEFYMRDLIGGNRKEGNIQSSTPPPVSPPRQLTDPLRDLILNDACSADCLSILALIETVLVSNKNSNDVEDPRYIERDIQQRITSYRERARRGFYARAPWQAESLTDQYFFDLTSYALWRTAADLLPNYQDRDAFVRKTGRFIYKNCKKYELLKNEPVQKDGIKGTVDCVDEVLQLFQLNGFCSGYRLGEAVKELPFFDELDDDALKIGGAVDCLISVFNPATLGAALQITGEQSRFAPDFIGPTLAAMWETVGLRPTWETYFVDQEYRPNPKGTTFSVLFIQFIDSIFKLIFHTNHLIHSLAFTFQKTISLMSSFFNFRLFLILSLGSTDSFENCVIHGITRV